MKKLFHRSQQGQPESGKVEEFVNLSPNVVRDMLDIKVLSMIKDGQVKFSCHIFNFFIEYLCFD